jgi:hypothetical protein
VTAPRATDVRVRIIALDEQVRYIY